MLSYYVSLPSEPRVMITVAMSAVVCTSAHVLFRLVVLFVFVCAWWCSTRMVLCFSFVLLHLVYPMLLVSLD